MLCQHSVVSTEYCLLPRGSSLPVLRRGTCQLSSRYFMWTNKRQFRRSYLLWVSEYLLSNCLRISWRTYFKRQTFYLFRSFRNLMKQICSTMGVRNLGQVGAVAPWILESNLKFYFQLWKMIYPLPYITIFVPP